MEIKKLTLDRLVETSILFDLYRQFYGKPSDVVSAYNFLEERQLNKESIILIAILRFKIAGFIQLFATFSSLNLGRTLILNDLFVLPEFRKMGIATNLILACKKTCQTENFYELILETEKTNTEANELYKRLGFQPNTIFTHYYWKP